MTQALLERQQSVCAKCMGHTLPGLKHLCLRSEADELKFTVTLTAWPPSNNSEMSASLLVSQLRRSS